MRQDNEIYLVVSKYLYGSLFDNYPLMEGFELFDAPMPTVRRIDVSSFDADVLLLYQCVQKLIGGHLGVLRKELEESGSLTAFSSSMAEIYRLLCVHEYSTLQIESFSVADQLWEELLSGNTLICCKEGFLISQIISCFASLILQLDKPLLLIPEELIANIQRIDRSVMMGAPVDIAAALYEQYEKIRQKNENRMKSVVCASKHLKVPASFSYDLSRSISFENKIPVFSNRIQERPMSVEQFQVQYYAKQEPIIFQHSNGHWKAFQKWRELSMWCKEYGHRLVPIEIGRLDPLKTQTGNWKESTFTMAEYIHQFIEPNVALCVGEEKPEMLENDSIGYLAQHHLFDQFPGLQEDFDIPPYCKVSNTNVQINAWFGTQDTVTSLHFDSYDNFLTQIFGYKYVRLYAPSQSEKLYPMEGNSSGPSIAKQNNISPIDVESPNLESYPDFATAPYFECVLGPHDMLFIPHHWWHYVRSLSPSFSVNFWF